MDDTACLIVFSFLVSHPDSKVGVAFIPGGNMKDGLVPDKYLEQFNALSLIEKAKFINRLGRTMCRPTIISLDMCKNTNCKKEDLDLKLFAYKDENSGWQRIYLCGECYRKVRQSIWNTIPQDSFQEHRDY